MNIFKLLFRSIRLKLYLKIAKRNLQLIKYFEEQQKSLKEIMTSYEVKDKLVELKAPKYEYYSAHKIVSLNETLKNEISKNDIPKGADIKTVTNPLSIQNEEGYYCLANKKIENFAIINGEKHPLQELAAGLPYNEIYEEKEKYEDGYYKKIIIEKRYFLAKKEIRLHKINDFESLSEEIKINTKLVDDISKITEEGYYKVIV